MRKDFDYEPDLGVSTKIDYRLKPTYPHTLFEVKSHSYLSKQAIVIYKGAEENTRRFEAGEGMIAGRLDPYTGTL